MGIYIAGLEYDKVYIANIEHDASYLMGNLVLSRGPTTKIFTIIGNRFLGSLANNGVLDGAISIANPSGTDFYRFLTELNSELYAINYIANTLVKIALDGAINVVGTPNLERASMNPNIGIRELFSHNNTLYLVSGQATSDPLVSARRLYSVNPENAATTVLVRSNNLLVGSRGITSHKNRVYAIVSRSTSNVLVTVNLSNGVLTDIVRLSRKSFSLCSLNDTLYTFVDRALYTINETNGTLTKVADALSSEAIDNLGSLSSFSFTGNGLPAVRTAATTPTMVRIRDRGFTPPLQLVVEITPSDTKYQAIADVEINSGSGWSSDSLNDSNQFTAQYSTDYKARARERDRITGILSDWKESAVFRTADEPSAEPVFNPDTGSAFFGFGITTYAVPAATGQAPITYSIVGSLPTGVSFSGRTLTRESNAEAGTYTIVVRATNSLGSDDFTLTLIIR